MIVIKTFCLGLIAVSVCFSLSISGKVTDTSGSPIAGASVRLEQNGATAISGNDGKFTLGDVGIKDQSSLSKPCRFSVSITNNLLFVNLLEKSDVDVITYNLHGQAISKIRKAMNVGTNSIILPYFGSGVFLYKVKSGNMEFMLKSNSVNQFSQGKAVLEKGYVFNNSLAKQMKVTTVINDVIAVTKDKYLDYRCVMYNSDTTGVEIKMIVCADTVRDIDGNLYHAVRIGNQVWTVENLRVTKYTDGSAIPLDTSAATWFNATSSKYCFYQNTINPDSINKYGALYNWYVVNPASLKKISPMGWHVPNDSEWTIMENYLVLNGYNWDGTTTGNKIAKSLAAKTDWDTGTGTIGPILTKYNKTGFSARPVGCRNSDGTFGALRYAGCWWSTTQADESTAWNRALYYGYDYIYMGQNNKCCGFSVRLVRDN